MLHMIGVCFLGLGILKRIIDYGPPPQYYRRTVTLVFTVASFSLNLDGFSGSRCSWQNLRREMYHMTECPRIMHTWDLCHDLSCVWPYWGVLM